MSDFYNLIDWRYVEYYLIFAAILLLIIYIGKKILKQFTKSDLKIGRMSINQDQLIPGGILSRHSLSNNKIKINDSASKIYQPRITLPRILTRRRVNANVRKSEKLSEVSGVPKSDKGVPQPPPPQGNLLYTHPTTMVVDIPERMSAAITVADLTPQARSFLSSQMAGNTDKIKTEPIKVKQVMTLTLVADSRHFSISSLSAHQQLLTGDYGNAVWHWDVLPLMRGSHKLEIVVNCCHQLVNGSIVESAEVPPKAFVIKVKINKRRTAAIWLASIAGALLLTFTSAFVTHYFPSIVRYFDTFINRTPAANDQKQLDSTNARTKNGGEPSAVMPQSQDILPAAKKIDTEDATEHPMTSE